MRNEMFQRRCAGFACIRMASKIKVPVEVVRSPRRRIAALNGVVRQRVRGVRAILVAGGITTAIEPGVRPSPLECSETYVMHKGVHRSEEHTSELQSLMRISYAVFCLKKKQTK